MGWNGNPDGEPPRCFLVTDLGPLYLYYLRLEPNRSCSSVLFLLLLMMMLFRNTQMLKDSNPQNRKWKILGGFLFFQYNYLGVCLSVDASQNKFMLIFSSWLHYEPPDFLDRELFSQANPLLLSSRYPETWHWGLV